MEKLLKRATVFAAAFALAAALIPCFNMTVMAAGTPENITLNKKKVTMTVGSHTTLKVKAVKPKTASKKVSWKSSNKKVATVNAKGVVRAKKTGTATITARALGGKVIAKCKIKVTAQKISDNSNKTLVAYFSATGTTKNVAGKIAKASGGDLYEIVPQIPYTKADLDYNNNHCRANQEMADENARPQIKGSVKNMTDYDVVFIGFPIWWGTAPRIMDTFVESYDFSGKTVIPFCTSGGSGISTASSDLQKLCNGKSVWKNGRRFDSEVSQSTIDNWVKSLGLK